MAFTLPITVRFQHCDLAGIVFYPRYFEMFNLTVEEWFEKVIGIGFSRLHSDMRIGIPVVHMENRFMAKSRLEDNLEFTLTVNRLGDSSINMTIQAACDQEVRCSSDMTLVCIDLDSGNKQSWPEEIRSKIRV
ncbi:MAG TPA: thioesterase family protein [Rhodospirillales bacterium]|nr:thioesterase family protein [Rhodospirillales bacterium]|tara:strand:- start:1179 stop:1577 length:399 start_codon:yes stop_codon:yes gene_type:complete